MTRKRNCFADSRVRLSQPAFSALEEFSSLTGLTKYEIASAAVLRYISEEIVIRKLQISKGKNQAAIADRLSAMQQEIADVRVQLGLHRMVEELNDEHFLLS